MTVYKDPGVTHYEFTPEVTRSLYSMLAYGAKHGTDRAEAIEYFGTRITYGELMQTVDAFAAGLMLEGVKKGDFVTIYLPNIPQCIFAVYATSRLGAVCNLVHPLSSKKEVEYCVTLTGSKYILAFEGNEGKAAGHGAKVIRCRTPEYFPKTPKGMAMKTYYNFSIRNEEKAAFAKEWEDVFNAGRKYLRRGGKLPEDTMKAEDTAAIMYTGGTTGDAKGVMLSNAAINAATTTMMKLCFEGIPHIGMAFLSILPVFHAFGFSLVIHEPLAGGMRIILRPTFNEKECAKLILEEKIETVAGVPSIFERLYPLIKDHDLSFIRYVAAGGDRVSRDLAERYNKILPSTKFRPGYGLTESCGCCILGDDKYEQLIEGCVGQPLPGVDICVTVPGSTKLVADGEEGELCIRNAALMTGYYKNAKATADVLRLHADGLIWLHTGDVVTVDAEKNVIFKSRCKRMIKVNGFNVYPTMIETAMELCPLIEEVCAVAMPWKNDDRRVKLFVTLKDPSMNQEEAKKEIMEFAREHVNRWSCPKEVRILEKMPLTKMNKTDYKVLENE
ncbi:MAG TPA: class I adenylate-forming enzyme family protein [Methanocorpusculum sp.]|nr:class I adenylate-forming enzyme family protein [Methanocorpusculum sp.]